MKRFLLLITLIATQPITMYAIPKIFHDRPYRFPSNSSASANTQQPKPSFAELLGGQEVYDEYLNNKQEQLDNALSEAIKDLDPKRVESLLKRGAHGHRVLHQLVDAWYLNGSKDSKKNEIVQNISKLLIGHGADILEKDENGLTPARHALETKCIAFKELEEMYNNETCIIS